MRVYLGLGTNLGDKESNLHVAVRKINERIGEVTALSAFYVTAPWGFSSENSFLNAACCVESVLPPLDILRETQEIERELGRMKKSAGGNYSDRLIDIDILLYVPLKNHRLKMWIGSTIGNSTSTNFMWMMCSSFRRGKR